MTVVVGIGLLSLKVPVVDSSVIIHSQGFGLDRKTSCILSGNLCIVSVKVFVLFGSI